MQSTMVVAIDTLRSRLSHVTKRPDIMIFDEAHHVMAASWRKVWAWAGPDVFHIGLTATPERLDGKGLGSEPGEPGFQTMILGPTTGELMSMGNLSGYRAWSSLVPNLKGVKTTAGDYNLGELTQRVTDSVITGDIVRTYQQRCPGKRAIYFCVGIDYSKALAAAFNAAGIRAEHLDGELDTAARIAAAKRFAKGETMVLTNCSLLGEGYDLAAQAGMDVTVEAVGLVRPTQSMALHLQQIGRSLRPKPYPAIILDHAGNIKRHGLPDSDREWSLEGRQKDKADAAVHICRQCFAANPMHAKVCMACGAALVEQREARKEPEHIDGELHEVTLEMLQHRRRNRGALISRAKTFEDFKKIGKHLGYKAGWAWMAWKESVARRKSA
jgi:superfamily II DNA or RNA helicase